MGCSITLKDVRHVPDLRLNLMSTLALDRQGYESYFGKGCWKLSKGSLVVARGEVCCTLYKTQLKMNKGGLFAMENESSPNLWHKRLAHMSERGLQILTKKELIPCNTGTSLDPCDFCVIAKHHKVSFQSSFNKKTEVLSVVYSDVCGHLK